MPPSKKRHDKKIIAMVTEEPVGTGGVSFGLHTAAGLLERGYRVALLSGTHKKFHAEIEHTPLLKKATNFG